MIGELRQRTTPGYRAKREQQGNPVNVTDIRNRLIRSNFHIADLNPFPESLQQIVTELYCALCEFAVSDQGPGKMDEDVFNSFLEILANNKTYLVTDPNNVRYSPLARAIIHTLTERQGDPQTTQVPNNMAPSIIPYVGQARLHHLGVPIEKVQRVESHPQRSASNAKPILSSRQQIIIIAAVVAFILVFACAGFYA
jgi:hypothetical protein